MGDMRTNWLKKNPILRSQRRKIEFNGEKLGPEQFLNRMQELQQLGLECDPIQVLMEVAIGKKLTRVPGTDGTSSEHYITEDLIGSYDKHGEPMDVDAATKVRAAEALCSYIFPKRKSVEVSTTGNKPILFGIMADFEGAAEIVGQRSEPQTIEGNSQPNRSLMAPPSEDEPWDIGNEPDGARLSADNEIQPVEGSADESADK